MEYGLTIMLLTNTQTKVLEQAQDYCLRTIFGGSKTASTKVMRHLLNLPTMRERSEILK
ncbi:uncharacterized protein B0P05DRAFT_552739 [Gilbertella persicaria]|uniref:uncharacterized protein n=1 Tax=Gilbertella persicaria TaxID=101096 RepID=UPI002220F0A6|nr:uncharacterized protein B0P05DRAFT_552739 [Gilbertella persicaria]KAI8067724.1 hypothetical protein B0P05DRAFT_552739 [Gilbertella persicaria]